jgi:hypothetical protein
MKLTISGVPAGTYVGEFLGAECRDPQPGSDFGPALQWRFLIVGGARDGLEVSRFTGNSPTTKNACGKFLRAITGKQLSPGEVVDLDPYVGRRFNLVVAESPSGNGTRVETVVAFSEGGA